MFPYGGRVSEPWGPGGVVITDLENGSPAEPKDNIHSVACEV